MKCSFCGGDVIDGRCQDCGMPYATEKRYSLRSEGESVHTHDVNGEKVLHLSLIQISEPTRRS